jgi:hypothetical protein
VAAPLQQETHGLVPSGPDEPLWWTLRRPFRPLSYHAARAMFDRANAAAGTGWPLHSLRHTAAYRLARDPAVPISGVQWILGHQSLSTTQIYVAPPPASSTAHAQPPNNHADRDSITAFGRRHDSGRLSKVGDSRMSCGREIRRSARFPVFALDEGSARIVRPSERPTA